MVASAKAKLDAATAVAAAAKTTAAQQASGSLEADRAELARLTEQQTKLQGAFDATNADNDGILIRLEALSQLADKNATLATAQFMLSLLFMCVELLPVLMKLLLNFSPPSTYDKVAGLRDEGDIAVEELQQEARKIVEQAQADLLVMAEKERVERQKELVLARTRARLALAQQRAEAGERPDGPNRVDDDEPHWLWDTGPLRLARRTLRPVRRRPAQRVAS